MPGASGGSCLEGSPSQDGRRLGETLLDDPQHLLAVGGLLAGTEQPSMRLPASASCWLTSEVMKTMVVWQSCRSARMHAATSPPSISGICMSKISTSGRKRPGRLHRRAAVVFCLDKVAAVCSPAALSRGGSWERDHRRRGCAWDAGWMNQAWQGGWSEAGPLMKNDQVSRSAK